ncbi:hypothetical protein [Paraburkholderia phenazinium]|jgi:hypothetical protein|uniref:hypothetical protein n=1 Tax=Paraburkholderia phenazinium TaxID=60549 RepID=UPI000B807E70|nr:hypothetical protein [Paraburkholderia phenazinium]
MKNHAFGRITARPAHEPLNWKPLAAASKHSGEPASRAAFISLPAWPGYRDAVARTAAGKAACQQLALSVDADTDADALVYDDPPRHSD